jgi:ribosome-associated protein
MMARMRSVPIRDDAIRLGQFLKLADLVGDGSEVKRLVASGEVLVNGEAEVRRGRRLAKGDVVTVRDEQARVG